MSNENPKVKLQWSDANDGLILHVETNGESRDIGTVSLGLDGCDWRCEMSGDCGSVSFSSVNYWHEAIREACRKAEASLAEHLAKVGVEVEFDRTALVRAMEDES